MSEQERFRFYGAAYLVLISDGKVLLSRRYNTGYQDGNYSLVAGHLDGGETAKQCIVREAREETGIVLCMEDLEVVHVMQRKIPPREYFDIYIRAQTWDGDITNMEPGKCDDLTWCCPDTLPKNMVPDVKCALENIGNDIHYSEFGWDN